MIAFPGARVLVTGGAGFIGSHLVDALVASGARVTVLDDFSSGRRENLPALDGTVKVIAGDICDERTLSRAVMGSEIVMHLAVRGLRLSFSDPGDLHRVNSEGTLRLLLAAARERVRRVVYVSSSEVYGSATRVPMAEDHPLEPTTIYGATKLAGEFYAKSLGHTTGLSTVIVRPFNTYGPRANFAGVCGEVIPRFTVQLLNGRAPVIFGDGLQTRDFTQVSDTVRGILLAATGTEPGPLNIARGEEVSIRRVAALLGDLIDPALAPEFAAPRPADVRRHVADVSSARSTLGFTASVSIEEGLRQYVEWFRKAYPDPARCLIGYTAQNW